MGCVFVRVRPSRFHLCLSLVLCSARCAVGWLEEARHGFLYPSLDFSVVFLLLPGHFSFPERGLDHLHLGPCPLVLLSLVFRGLSQARRAGNTGKGTTSRLGVGVRVDGKGLAWNMAEGSAC